MSNNLLAMTAVELAQHFETGDASPVDWQRPSVIPT
ncbi:MAG: hypothetical protein ACI9MU_004297 [Alphaproteobacteria bacterium]|jgi:hypothetical protein